MKRAYSIITTKTISTEICVIAESLEEVQELYYDGEYDDLIDEAEMEQWNVVDTDHYITDLTAQRMARSLEEETK